MNTVNTQRKSTQPYEIFVFCLTVLSLINFLLYFIVDSSDILYVIMTMDVVFSIFFLIDFIKRLKAAESKVRYFFRDFGWADLLASLPLPQFKILRIFRLIKAYALIKKAGGRAVIRDFMRNKATGAVYIIFFMIIMLLEFGSIFVLAAESSSPEANIKTASDAIWWTYVTITTVGYGDRYPTTNTGRFIGMIVMFVGVGLFAVMTGFLANKFLPSDKGESPVTDNDVAALKQELADIKKLLTK